MTAPFARTQRLFDAVYSWKDHPAEIGCHGSVTELQAALGCFARHSESGGVVLVEPWLRHFHSLVGYDPAGPIDRGLDSGSRP